MSVSGRNYTEHVAHGGDPTGVGMDCPDPNYKRDHQHTHHWSAIYPVEGGGGADRHLSTRKPPVAWCPPRVQVRNRDRDSYNGVKACSRAHHHRPIPLLPGIPGPKENLWHRGPRTPPHNTGRIWSGPLPVWTLGDLMGPPASGGKTEWLPRTSLTHHKGCRAA